MGHNFANKLRSVLSDKNMSNFDVIEVGLSPQSDQDYEWSSFKPMEFQMQKLCHFIKNQSVLSHLEEKCTRIQLVGCSQGALLLRALLWDQCLDSVVPKIDKLITLGGPNSGIFGVPNCEFLINNSNGRQSLVTFGLFGCRFLQATISSSQMGPALYDNFIYSMSRVLSFSSYWNSPANPIRLTTFLADINNENSENKTKYLSQKLKALVLISFEKERIVLPQITTSFGYWDPTANHLIPFNETEFYLKDWFGLRTLDENNSIIFKTIPNSTHMSIPFSFIEHEFLPLIN